MCLQTLSRLDYPRERFEVIVVDDGQRDAVRGSRHVLSRLSSGEIAFARHTGPAAARSAGTMRARGKYLAFTDDDCLPATNWPQALKARFERPPDHLIGGRVVNGFPQNPYSTAAQLLVDYL